MVSLEVSSATTSSVLPLTGGVLLASHGGPASDAAARVASLFATRTHAPMEALAVLEPMSADLTGYVGASAELEADRRHWLTDAVEGQLIRASVSDTVPIVTETGSAAECVAGRAKARGAALIAVGIGSHGAVNRLLGETTIAVIRRTAVPVIAVSPRAVVPMRSIIVATDFSPASRRAAGLALTFAPTDVTLHLVHAWPWMDLKGSNATVRQRVYRAGVEALFAELVESLHLPTTARVSTHIAQGDAATVVRRIADEHQADLIALGSHGRGFVDRLTLGSVAEAVLRSASATCSVLVVPPTPAEKES